MGTAEIVNRDLAAFSMVDLANEVEGGCLADINSTHLFFNFDSGSSILNMETNEWTGVPRLPVAWYEHVCGRIENPSGGTEIVMTGGQNTRDTHILNLASMEWRAGPDFPAVASAMQASRVQLEQYSQREIN